MKTMGPYRVGEIYDRQKDVHDRAREQGLSPDNRQAGIVRIGQDQFIFWNPYKKLYANRWIREPEEFVYSGEGSEGDMKETGGNAELLEHESNDEPVLVFYKVHSQKSRWLHLGHFRVFKHEWDMSDDDRGLKRRDLRFHLRRADQLQVDVTLPTISAPTPPAQPTEAELWKLIMASGDARSPERQRRSKWHQDKRVSDPLLSAYARVRAQTHGGTCELCGQPPGWLTADAFPYFQVHHIHPDIDLVDWIAAVCGSCHDRLHHSTDRLDMGRQLRATVVQRQEALGRPLNDYVNVELGPFHTERA